MLKKGQTHFKILAVCCHFSTLCMKGLKLSKENPAKAPVVKQDFHKAMAPQTYTCKETDTSIYKFIKDLFEVHNPLLHIIL